MAFPHAHFWAKVPKRCAPRQKKREIGGHQLLRELLRAGPGEWVPAPLQLAVRHAPGQHTQSGRGQGEGLRIRSERKLTEAAAVVSPMEALVHASPFFKKPMPLPGGPRLIRREGGEAIILGGRTPSTTSGTQWPRVRARHYNLGQGDFQCFPPKGRVDIQFLQGVRT